MFKEIEMDDTTADAILIAGFKGSKIKPVSKMLMARAVRFRVEQGQTYDQIAEYYKVSRTLVAQFDKLNNLHKKVQSLIDQNKLGLDQGYRISFLPKERQEEAAYVSSNMNAHDTRHLIEIMKNNSHLSAQEAKERLQKAKTVLEKMHLLIIPLPSDVFVELKNIATKEKMEVQELVMSLIKKRIGRRNDA